MQLCFACLSRRRADLSGQCYPARIARKWGDRVIQEFTAQARREEELGLPVMPFMQNLTRPLDRARLQLRFVNQVVLPLWTAMNELLHGLAVPVDNLYVCLCLCSCMLRVLCVVVAGGVRLRWCSSGSCRYGRA